MVLLNKLIVMFHRILAIEFTKDRELNVLAQSQQPTVLENHQITSNSSYQAQYSINRILSLHLFIHLGTLINDGEK